MNIVLQSYAKIIASSSYYYLTGEVVQFHLDGNKFYKFDSAKCDQ